VVLRFAVLGLLAEMPRSGYDLAKAFRTSFAHAWSARHSQIYPELAKLAAEGLVVAAVAGRRRRKVYSVTPAGKAILRAWLLDTEPERSTRSEAAVRLFLLWTLRTDEQVAHLDREREYERRTLAELERISRFHEATGIPNPYRLQLEWGLRQQRARIDWIDWAIDEINAGRGPEVGVEEHRAADAAGRSNGKLAEEVQLTEDAGS
jgi:PadR family transcriptional regulator AphA